MLTESIKSDIQEAQQKARAQLRESFIKAVRKCQGEPMKLLTYELSSLNATFYGWKADGSEMLVRNLETPANMTMESALLRSPDIIALHFENTFPLS